MKTFLVFILLTIFLTGCVPLTELSQVSGPTHPEVSLYDRCVRAGFDLNHERIDTQQSYIKSPAGRRYSLQVQTNQFDIVLMDLQMPIMDGYEATIAIRNGEAGILNANIPIIAVTADVMETTKQRVKEIGMNQYLSKPINKETLFQMIKDLV